MKTIFAVGTWACVVKGGRGVKSFLFLIFQSFLQNFIAFFLSFMTNLAFEFLTIPPSPHRRTPVYAPILMLI